MRKAAQSRLLGLLRKAARADIIHSYHLVEEYELVCLVFDGDPLSRLPRGYTIHQYIHTRYYDQHGPPRDNA